MVSGALTVKLKGKFCSGVGIGGVMMKRVLLCPCGINSCMILIMSA